VLFDRVYGRVPHRYNLHVTGTNIERSGQVITADGRFDLDLLVHVQHPAAFTMETGELVPNVHKSHGGEDAPAKHAQHFFRLYNETDGMYRTLLFARERERDVTVSDIGECGIKVVTSAYTDYVFVHNDWLEQQTEDVSFSGRVGWIRRAAEGTVEACVTDGDYIRAFGVSLRGRGPWSYNLAGSGATELRGGPPRTVLVEHRDDKGATVRPV
jgi:hypothetical protein